MLGDVVQHRAGDVPVRRVEDRQRHRDVALVPLAPTSCVGLRPRRRLHGHGGQACRAGWRGRRRGPAGSGACSRETSTTRVDAAGQRHAGRARGAARRRPGRSGGGSRASAAYSSGHGDHHEPGAVGELGDQHDRPGPAPVKPAPSGVDRPATGASRRRAPAVALGAQAPVPVPDHAGLAERERDEHADDVQLDQPGDVGVEGADQQRRRARRSMTMPLENTSRSPRRCNWRGQVAVAGRGSTPGSGSR